MSRSVRKTSIIGMDCSDSEKPEKRQAHRIERRLVREILRLKDNADMLPHLREAAMFGRCPTMTRISKFAGNNYFDCSGAAAVAQFRR